MYPFRLIKELVDAFPRAAREAADAQQYIWELAMTHAGIPDSEVRVLSIEPLVLLVGEDWVVEHIGGDDFSEREWE